MIYEDKGRELRSIAKDLLKRETQCNAKLKYKKKKRKELREKRKALGIELDSLIVLKKYIKGIPVAEIAKDFFVSPTSINQIINKMLYSLVNVKTAQMLEEYNENNKNVHSLTAIDKIGAASNDPFLSLLSPPHGELTEAETNFCVSLVYGGDYIQALEDSGLSEGIINNDDVKISYSTALASRRTALEHKPNVKEFLLELRGLVAPTVNKELVQKELMDLYVQMRNRGDRRDTNNILRTLEMIGKTEGVFTDKVQIEEISASSTLDKLIAEAEKAQVIEIGEDGKK